MQKNLAAADNIILKNGTTVEEAIKSVTDVVTDSTSVTGVIFSKKNGIITVNIYSHTTAAASIKFNVPATFRPSNSHVLSVGFNLSSSAPCFFDIEQNGDVRIRNLSNQDLTANNTVFGSLTYV